MSDVKTKTAAPAEAPQKAGCCGRGEVIGMAKKGQRGCRDLLCLIIFAIFWVGMFVIGGLGFKYGNYRRLVYATDYTGEVCNVGPRAGLKYAVYPRLGLDFFLNINKSPVDYTFYGVCVSTCPSQYQVVCNYNVPTGAGSAYNQTFLQNCMNNFTPYTATGTCLTIVQNCWTMPVATSPVFYRCIPAYNTTTSAYATCVYPPNVVSPTDPACITVQTTRNSLTESPAQGNQIFDAMNTARQTFGRYFGDLARAWWVILLCAIGVTLILGFIWLMMAKIFTPLFVWGTIVLVITLLALMTGYFYYKGGLVGGINLPDSVETQLAKVQSAINSAQAQATYLVPQSFDAISISQSNYRIIAYVSTAVTIIALIIVVALRRAISTAIKAIKLGAQALQDMPTLTCFPITTILMVGIFLVWWVWVAASLATSGQISAVNVAAAIQSSTASLGAIAGVTNATLNAFLNQTGLNDSFFQFQDYPVMNYLLIYHFFGLLWTSQFLLGCAAMTVAGAVCAWYFSRIPAGSKEVKRSICNPLACCCGRSSPIPEGSRPATFYHLEAWPVMASMTRVICYYLGTVAFGSCLVAIMQFIRSVVAYLHKKMNNEGAKNNRTLQFLCCCLQCCLLCMQKLIEVVNRNAYVYTALKGTSFCESGAKVVKMIMSNAATMAAVNVLTEILTFLGKVLIAIASSWVAYAIIENASTFQPDGDTPLSSSWLIILVNLFFSYVAASCFFLVFDICIDSVLVCYLVDKTENGGVAAHCDAGKFDELVKHAREHGGIDEPNRGDNGGNSGNPTSPTNKAVVVAPSGVQLVAPGPATISNAPPVGSPVGAGSGSASYYA